MYRQTEQSDRYIPQGVFIIRTHIHTPMCVLYGFAQINAEKQYTARPHYPSNHIRITMAFVDTYFCMRLAFSFFTILSRLILQINKMKTSQCF